MKKVSLIVFVLSLLVTGVVVSCSKTSEDKLGAPTATACDTTHITYTTNVVSLLQANCYSCHGNGQNEGGINLDTYANVKALADNGVLLGVITHAPGYSPMPNGLPMLSDCDINLIRAWINGGALNN